MAVCLGSGHWWLNCSHVPAFFEMGVCYLGIKSRLSSFEQRSNDKKNKSDFLRGKKSADRGRCFRSLPVDLAIAATKNHPS